MDCKKTAYWTIQFSEQFWLGPLFRKQSGCHIALQKKTERLGQLVSNFILIVFGIYLGSKQQLKPLNNKFTYLRHSPAIYRMSLHWIYGLFQCSKCASCENILCVSLVVFDQGVNSFTPCFDWWLKWWLINVDRKSAVLRLFYCWTL